MLFCVFVEHEYDWIMFISIRYSFKSENNCCSVYMNKTFNGHTPNVNGLLNLNSVIHIFIILMPKDAKLIMIVQLICGTTVYVILV